MTAFMYRLTARRRARNTAVAMATVPVVLGLAAVPAFAARPPTRQQVSDIRPAWARPASDAGAVPAAAPLSLRVYLAGRDPAGLASYARQVSDPHSPLYGHYLTPAQYQTRFGPTAAQTGAVRSWLTGAGLHVTAVNSHYVAVTGSAGEAGTAFGTALHRYRMDGTVLQAPSSQVSVPASVAPAVLTITGLATPAARMTPDLATGAGVLTAAGTEPPPINKGTCSAYWGQKQATSLPTAYGHTLPYDLCGYVPSQLRAAYGVAGSGLTGKGVTVAIVDTGASPTIAADVSTYSRRHGLAPLRPGQLSQYLPANIGTSCGTSSGYIEETLDAESVHTMAPDAHIAYVGADCTNYATDSLDAVTRIVDHHLADIVSDSWYLDTETQLTPDIVTAYTQVFEQGAVEGIGFYFSAGDQGDWTPFGALKPSVQFPASDPWVTSVGGTTLATSRDGRYLWETAWGNDATALASNGKSWASLPGGFIGGTGGGASELFSEPFYQRGIVPVTLSTPPGAAGPMRVMPDIAADADGATGMRIGLTATLSQGGTPQYVEILIGGTSLATPLIAGIQADAQQARNGVAIGFANPAIYARYRTPAYHDVTGHPLGTGTTLATVNEMRNVMNGAITDLAITLAQDTSLQATAGYDDTTGVGTPDRAYLNSYRTTHR